MLPHHSVQESSAEYKMRLAMYKIEARSTFVQGSLVLNILYTAVRILHWAILQHDEPTDLFFRLNTLCTHLSGSNLWNLNVLLPLICFNSFNFQILNFFPILYILNIWPSYFIPIVFANSYLKELSRQATACTIIGVVYLVPFFCNRFITWCF